MPGFQAASSTSEEQGRPPGISLLSILFFLVGLFYLLKFSQVIHQWATLISLPMTISPVYLLIDGFVWTCSAFFLSWILWTGKAWSQTAGLLLSFGYCLVFWTDRIWIAEPELISQRWPVNLTLTIIGLGFIIFILAGKPSREYFRKNPVKIP